MRRWPVQVLSYKVGEDLILRLREQAQADPGFDIKRFHSLVLSRGSIPLDVLEAMFKDHYRAL